MHAFIILAAGAAWGLVSQGDGREQSPSPATADRGLAVAAPEIEGPPAAANQFPFAVALDQAGDAAECSGSLVDARWVLTAGHCGCVRRATVGRRDLRTNDGRILTVDFGFVHSRSNRLTGANDIALHHLASSALQVPGVRTVEPETDATWDQRFSRVTVAGWGMTGNGVPPPDLRFREVDVVGLGTCASQHTDGAPVIAPEHLCTSSDPGGVRDRDSGGPVVIRPASGPPRLVAVIGQDGGLPRAERADVHARVLAHADWIQPILDGTPADQLRDVRPCGDPP